MGEGGGGGGGVVVFHPFEPENTRKVGGEMKTDAAMANLPPQSVFLHTGEFAH